MKHYIKISTFILVFFITACDERGIDDKVHAAYKPILMESGKVTTEVKLLSTRENKSIALMRNMGNHLLALDYGFGIHIIDVTNSSNPIKKGFFQIPACIDFEVRGNIVYANNYRDFIVIDFTDINNPVITKREAGAFDIVIKSPDGLDVWDKLKDIPANTTIISYEKL